MKEGLVIETPDGRRVVKGSSADESTGTKHITFDANDPEFDVSTKPQSTSTSTIKPSSIFISNIPENSSIDLTGEPVNTKPVEERVYFSCTAPVTPLASLSNMSEVEKWLYQVEIPRLDCTRYAD